MTDHFFNGFADELIKTAADDLLPLAGAAALGGLLGRFGGRRIAKGVARKYEKTHPARMKRHKELVKKRGGTIGNDAPKSPDAYKGMAMDIGGKLGLGAGIAGGAYAASGDTRKVTKLNPKAGELKKAFTLYRQETGKSQNEMSMKDIARYVKKVRGQSA